jgi:hypothetical protein
MKLLQSRRRLAVTLSAAALAAFAFAPGLVNAEPIGPTDPGVRCAAKVGPGQYEFYLPGERATDTQGNKWVCGPDGQWFRDYSPLIKSSTINLSPIVVSITTTKATASLR